jgi:polygalacturonase
MSQYGDPRWPNNDGIDIDSSQHVTLSHSDIDTGDDGVCLKTTLGCMDLFNITVSDVRVHSRSSAVKFGSATPVDMHHVLVQRVLVWDSNRGLGIQQRDQGNIWDVTFRDIVINGTRQWPVGYVHVFCGRACAVHASRSERPMTSVSAVARVGSLCFRWWGSGEPIWVSSMARGPGLPVGFTANVTFENIVAVSQNSVFVSGRAPGQVVQDVTLRNVSVLIDRWPSWNYRYDTFAQ